MKLTSMEQKIHEQALSLGRTFLQTQGQLLEVFARVSENRIHHKLGFRSLHEYGVKALGLSDAMAYALGAVLKKSKEVPVLGELVKEGELSLCRASRLIAVIKPENSRELIEFAKSHRVREIDQEVARRNPRKKLRDDLRNISGDCVRLSLSLTRAELKSFQRCQSLLASRKLHARNLRNDQNQGRDQIQENGKSQGSKAAARDLSGTLMILVEEFLQRHDPLLRAERCETRKKKKTQEILRIQNSANQDSCKEARQDLRKDLCKDLRKDLRKEMSEKSNDLLRENEHQILRKNVIEKLIETVSEQRSENAHEEVKRHVFTPPSKSRVSVETLPPAKVFSRTPLPAERKHQVYLRDRGRCTHLDPWGQRCDQDKYLHIHHVQPLAEGGSDELSNLTLLCSIHHDFAHQLHFADWQAKGVSAGNSYERISVF